jgi:hypothetical protein
LKKILIGLKNTKTTHTWHFTHSKGIYKKS